MLNTPPALQLYTLREQLAGGSRLDTLRSVRSFGYGAVEPYDVRADPGGQRADLDEAGLRVCSVHARVAGADAGEFFEGAKTLGAGTVIVPASRPEEFASAGAVTEFARELNEAAAKAADHGLRLGYHNHWYELEASIKGVTGLEALAGALDEEIVLEVDTYWAAVGLQDPEQVPGLLERLGERVRYLHVKDGPVVDKNDMMTAVGGGRMPVADVLAAAPAAEWHVVELDRCGTDMLAAVRESAEWLAGQGLARKAGTAG